jgi:UDP-GlcNAc:undecaprenyl-phosphate GlcNAc-1-phosphate transferase
VPVLVLCIPIFDTTFVTLMRKLAGRPASMGGRDHTSHRLVALGLSEKHAVWMLYALAMAGGPLALLVRKAPFDVSVAVISAFAIMLAFLGIHLARVRVYGEDELATARGGPIVALLFELSHKMRAFEVALDAILISLAYYLAYAFRFGPVDSSPDWQLFLKTLPIVISVKLATFLATGIYRGIWRYASLNNVLVFVRAVVVSTILTVLVIVFAFRFDGFSRSVFLLDGLFLVIFVTASRFAFKLLHRIFPSPNARTGRRVLIFGAGDGGELLYRELNNNTALNSVPVAFADDDRTKSGRLIHGLRVYRPTPSVAELCHSLRVEEVIISTSKVTDDRIAQIIAECAVSSVAVSRARIHFERLKPAELGWVLPSTPTVLTTVPLLKPRAEAGHSTPQPATDH